MRCLYRLAADALRDLRVRKRQLIRQTETVLRVPARVMRRIHDALAALCLELLPFVVRLHGERLVVREQHHVRPFFDERRDLAAGLLAELHLVAVIRPHFVRLFKFAHLCVRGQHDVYARLHDFLQTVEKPPEFLFFVYIAVTVAEVFNALLLVSAANIVDAQLLRPVDCIDDECAAHLRVLLDVCKLLPQHLPACGLVHAAHVHIFRTALGVDEQRVRELRGKSRFADALRPVNDDFFRRFDFARCDIH